jgi:hypothetical protein
MRGHDSRNGIVAIVGVHEVSMYDFEMQWFLGSGGTKPRLGLVQNMLTYRIK